jgi:phosphate transport system substrate-binding protein
MKRNVKLKSMKSMIAVVGAAVIAASALTPSATVAQSRIQINGSGATFPQPLYEDWAFGFGQVQPVTINYSGGGSGQGKRDITSGTVDFAGTDSPLTDAEAATRPLVQFPTVAGAVVPIYNVVGVTSVITLDGATLGAIYAGTIANWNDPKIAKFNPGVKFPNAPIITVFRSDGSGTTQIFTDYLTAVSEDWKKAVNPSSGSTVDWPTAKQRRGLGGRGNPGVASSVQKTNNSIGYVELAFAVNNDILYANMVNAAGKTVEASAEATTAAMKGAKFDSRNATKIVNSADPAAWPIAGFTYLIYNQDYPDCAKAGQLVGWMNWALNDEGAQAQATRGDYAVLSPDALALSTKAIGSITCNKGGKVTSSWTPK